MKPEEALEKQINFQLVAAEGDVYTFKHEDGHNLKVRLQPQKQPNGHFQLYEIWQKGPPGRSRRLFTERGYEWVFELPLLLEANLETVSSDAKALLERFFKEMQGETFKSYPRELFK